MGKAPWPLPVVEECYRTPLSPFLVDEETHKATLLPELSKMPPLLPVTPSLPRKLSFLPEEFEIQLKVTWQRKKAIIGLQGMANKRYQNLWPYQY